MALDGSRVMLVTKGVDGFHPTLKHALAVQGFTLLSAGPGPQLTSEVERKKPNAVVIAPSNDNTWDGLDAAASIRQLNPSLPLLFLDPNSSEQRIIDAFRAGAWDYIKYPCKEHELLIRIRYSVSRPPELSWRYSHSKVNNSKRSYDFKYTDPLVP